MVSNKNEVKSMDKEEMSLYEEKYQFKGNELMNQLLEQENAVKYVNKYKSKRQQKAADCRQGSSLEDEQ